MVNYHHEAHEVHEDDDTLLPSNQSFSYTYNAESSLIAAESNYVSPGSNYSRFEFHYDYFGRWLSRDPIRNSVSNAHSKDYAHGQQKAKY